MNSISIYGRLAAEPELKQYTNAKGEDGALCKFRVAVNRSFGDEADFFNCTVFGRRAEVIEKFFHKGSRIAITGSMQCDKVDDKYFWNLMVRDFDFVETKKESESVQANNVMDSYEEIVEEVPF